MSLQSRAAQAGNTAILTAETCGNCKYGNTVAEDLTMVECAGMPPIPAFAPIDRPPGFQVVAMRPRLPRALPACALHKRKVLVEGLN